MADDDRAGHDHAGHLHTGDVHTEDMARLEVLYRERYEPSVRLAHLLVGNRARAEELTQDAFVRLMPNLAETDNPAGYLRTILVNLCRDHQRREARARRQPGERPQSAPPPGLPATTSAVWQAVQELPERQRLALSLRFYADLPAAEIARLLGVRPATVRSLVHRGLTTLKEVVPRDG
ncbi:SigE family RNA polymerase sigma factor [soil metagenome]